MKFGGSLPAFSIGFSALPGSPRYLKTNGRIQGSQGHYYQIGCWDVGDHKNFMILPNTCFPNRYILSSADLRGLVSVTDKEHNGQFTSFLEHSRLGRLGVNLGLVHFAQEA